MCSNDIDANFEFLVFCICVCALSHMEWILSLAQNRTVGIDITVKYDYSIPLLLIMHVAEVSSFLHQRMNGTKSFKRACKMCNRTGYELRTFWSLDMNYFGMNFILTFACLISSTVLYREHDRFLVKDRSLELLHMISGTQLICTQHITINTAGHYKDTKAHTHISCIIIIRECYLCRDGTGCFVFPIHWYRSEIRKCAENRRKKATYSRI